MKEFQLDNAVVRVHPSKMTIEEFRANLEEAAVEFRTIARKEGRKPNNQKGRYK